MSRRSPRKKAISPEIVISSDDEELMAVASEDQYVAFFCSLVYHVLQEFLIYFCIGMRMLGVPMMAKMKCKSVSFALLCPFLMSFFTE